MIGKGKNLVGTKWYQEKNILDKSGFIGGCLEEIKKKYNLLSAFLLYQQQQQEVLKVIKHHNYIIGLQGPEESSYYSMQEPSETFQINIYILPKRACRTDTTFFIVPTIGFGTQILLNGKKDNLVILCANILDIFGGKKNVTNTFIIYKLPEFFFSFLDSFSFISPPYLFSTKYCMATLPNIGHRLLL